MRPDTFANNNGLCPALVAPPVAVVPYNAVCYAGQNGRLVIFFLTDEARE